MQGCARIISPRLKKPLAFGFVVPLWIVDSWHGIGHEQVIALAEKLPIVIVKKIQTVFEGAGGLSRASKSMLVETMVQDAMNDSLS